MGRNLRERNGYRSLNSASTRQSRPWVHIPRKRGRGMRSIGGSERCTMKGVGGRGRVRDPQPYPKVQPSPAQSSLTQPSEEEEGAPVTGSAIALPFTALPFLRMLASSPVSSPSGTESPRLRISYHAAVVVTNFFITVCHRLWGCIGPFMGLVVSLTVSEF